MQFNLETDLPQRMEAHEAHEQRLHSTQQGGACFAAFRQFGPEIQGAVLNGVLQEYGPRYLARRLSELPPTSASLSESAYETFLQ